MKKFMITSILLALFASGTNIMAQNQNGESLGLPGDNLNLYAVMKLFQESETLEGFEKSLNDENSKINNLDLNGDNYVDYIKVIDYVDGDVHNIVLQDAINNKENQDVAVFTVQRDNNGQVQIQLTGDEELYGRDYIIEPIFDEANNGQTPNPGYMGNTSTIDGRTVTVVRTTRLEIAAWPMVRFMYLPGYVTWHSSWYYDYYPSYFHPWRPYYWDYYYGYHYNWYNDYYAHYRRWDNHRYANWNDYYWVGRRSYSENVNARIKEGNYKSTYSHPEQRREGEVLYTRMYNEQKSRPADKPSGNNIDRRSGSQSTSGAVITRRAPAPVTNKPATRSSAEQKTNTTRQAPASVTNKPATRSSTQPNTSTTRRTPASVTNKPATKSSTQPNTSTTRRTPASVTNKPAAKPATEVNPGTARRSTPTVTNKPASNPTSGQRAGTAPTTSKSKSTIVSTPSRKSSVSSKPKRDSKEAGKSKRD